jgi:uncharacterized protein (DUF2336 family)
MLSLSKLSELAKDGSKIGRKSFVTALTDLFLSSEHEHAEQVSIMFGEIVMHVLGQLEQETRMALAQRIGPRPDTPRDLAVKLAEDTIEVAKPVLEASPVLESEDLETIAQSGSMEHLEVIASRDSLEENVTSVLVDRGNNETLTKVAGNKEAHLASETFQRLVEKARDCPEIQVGLIGRDDMPEEAARSLASFLTEELKERITSMGGDSVLAEVMAERAAEEVKARASRLESRRSEAAQIIEDVCNKKKPLDEAVSLFAKSERAAELGFLLAKVSKLPPASVSGLIYGKSDKPLVIICKAQNVSGEAFKHILTMRARQLPISGPELNDAIKRYAALPVQGAIRSLETIRGSDGADEEKAEAPKERGAFMRSVKKSPKAKAAG